MERPVKERLVGAAVLMAAAVILIPEMLSGPDRGSTEKSAEAGEGGVKTYTIDLSQTPGVTTAATSAPTADSRVPPPETMPSTSASAAEEGVLEPQASTARTSSAQNSSAQNSPDQTSAQASPESNPRTDSEQPAESSRAPATEAPPQSKPEPPPARAEARPPAQPEPKPQAKPEAPSRPVASAPPAPTSIRAPASSAPATKPAGNVVPAEKGWAVQLGSYSSESTARRLSSEWRAKGQNAFVMPVKSGGKTLYRVRLGPARDRAGAEAILKSVKASVPGAAVVTHP